MVMKKKRDDTTKKNPVKIAFIQAIHSWDLGPTTVRSG